MLKQILEMNKVPNPDSNGYIILLNCPFRIVDTEKVFGFMYSNHHCDLQEDFTDENDETLYRLVRFEMKSFMQSVLSSLPGVQKDSFPTGYKIGGGKDMTFVIEEVTTSVRSWLYFIGDQFPFRYPHSEIIQKFVIDIKIHRDNKLEKFTITVPCLFVLVEELQAVLIMKIREQAR